MGAIEILLIIIFATIGAVAVVTTIGFWGTVRPRLEHKEKMFELNEKAKINAIEIEGRDLANQERRMRMLASSQHPYRDYSD